MNVRNITDLRNLQQILNELTDVNQLTSNADGAVYINNRDCIGVRELISSIDENVINKYVDPKHLKVVYESPEAQNMHDVGMNILTAAPACGLLLLISEYKVGSYEGNTLVTFRNEMKTLVGSADWIAYDVKHKCIAIIEFKTKNANDTPDVPMLALYQLYYYKQILLRMHPEIRNITLYAFTLSRRKIICSEIIYIPQEHLYIRAFIERKPPMRKRKSSSEEDPIVIE